MAHGFADAQLPLRSAARGILLLVMTRHRSLSNRQCPHLLPDRRDSCFISAAKVAGSIRP
jgi:hypothetical protein